MKKIIKIILSYLKHAMIWLVTWIVICYLCKVINILNVDETILLIIIGVWSSIITWVGLSALDIIKLIEQDNKQ